MPPQTTTGSGNPATSASQGSPATGQSSTEPTGPSLPPPQPVSGTWVQADDPQILIQWTLTPPAPGSSAYTAQVGVYQLIFDTALPTPTAQSSTVPFSLTDPAWGPSPYLQGSFTLTQSPPTLAVANLQFPEFPAQTVTLASLPATTTTTTPTGGTSTGSSSSSTSSSSTTTTPPAGGAPSGGNTGAA